VIALTNQSTSVFIPDRSPLEAALERTTHLAVGAHPDDIPIMAFHGIVECYAQSKRWFTGVTVTDGAGTPRSGPYAEYSDNEMRAVRRGEEEVAAGIGEYSAAVHLDYTSEEVKHTRSGDVVNDLIALITLMRPDVVYTHNPADRHDTHVAVALRTIAAVRRLPVELRPTAVFGCEVWRDLDWVVDDDRVVFDVSGHSDLAAALIGAYESQISGGKRYDLATEGRRLAHATFSEYHRVDTATALIYAMDLTPLITERDVGSGILRHVDRLRDDVADRVTRTL